MANGKTKKNKPQLINCHNEKASWVRGPRCQLDIDKPSTDRRQAGVARKGKEGSEVLRLRNFIKFGMRRDTNPTLPAR